jgi:hypothetical protein
MNEYDREIKREFVKKINNVFIDDGIRMKYHLEMKKVNDRNNRNDNEKTFEEFPYKESIVIKSYKSIEEIEKYIQEKRNTYIEKFCEKDLKQAIYPVKTYGDSYLRLHKIPYNSNKSFDTWFSPHKKDVVNLLENFKNKSGIYALPSSQNKLGLLLYGEPGCGKTSLIKAIAKKLDKSIFPISLDKFKTLESLQNIFYNDYAIVNKAGYGAKWEYIPIHKRLIVFEEIDTAGQIVADREKLRDLINNKSNHTDNFDLVEGKKRKMMMKIKMGIRKMIN